MKTAPCKFIYDNGDHCGESWHTRSYHKTKSRAPMVSKKPMKKTGASTTKWTNTRRKWVKLNPPNHQGYYQCHICKGMVLATEMEVDHVISRSRAPELRYELSNLKPAHHACNTLKGSRDLSEL